jgi:hypothetical protein
LPDLPDLEPFSLESIAVEVSADKLLGLGLKMAIRIFGASGTLALCTAVSKVVVFGLKKSFAVSPPIPSHREVYNGKP